MNNHENNHAQNFQYMVETYEATIEEITKELDGVNHEQNTIENKLHELIKENSQLSVDLSKILEENSSGSFKSRFQEQDFIDNLKKQLEHALAEKEHVVKLWQNAVETIDYLEEELKVFQDTTYGFVPKAKLVELKNSYEDKLNSLQETLAVTRKKLEETLGLASKELKIRDKEICERLQDREGSFKIVKNLEDEVLKLQERLNESEKTQKVLEKRNKSNKERIEKLKERNKEYVLQVEEALQVVEAALNEKNGALFREAMAKEEVIKISANLSEVIRECDARIDREVNSAKQNFEEELEKCRQEIKCAQEELKIKTVELENCNRKCATYEREIAIIQKNNLDDSGASKLLVLEKNLENTFQKLLLSEKQNIQLKSEKESIKSDLDQMALIYERDINSREAEKASLKNAIKNLRMELDNAHSKLSESSEIITSLSEKITTIEDDLKGQIEESKREYDKFVRSKAETEELIEEYKSQLKSQMDINNKWRVETKVITEKLEDRIIDLKKDISKVKVENSNLKEKLSESKQKICEYKRFLEIVSEDVVKITNIALPIQNELDNR